MIRFNSGAASPAKQARPERLKNQCDSYDPPKAALSTQQMASGGSSAQHTAARQPSPV